jgi:hypothetical protein
MKKTSILIILIAFSGSLFSQSLKKAFKAFYNKDYTYAENIFKSNEHKNTCIGIYGQALVLHTVPVLSKKGETNEAHFERRIDKKLSAYMKVLECESMIGEVSDKELKGLDDYFSAEKVSELKKGIESYFLKQNPEYFDLSLLSNVKDISKGNEFYFELENKYIKYKIDEIKDTRSFDSKTEKTDFLIENFPENKQTKSLKRYTDSLRVDRETTIAGLVKILKKYPDNLFINDAKKKIFKLNEEYNNTIKTKKEDYQKIVVWLEYDSEEAVLGKMADWYYYNIKNNRKTREYHFLVLSDAEMKKYNTGKKYLLYEYLNYNDMNRAVKRVEDNRSNYPDSYILDLKYGYQLFSKEKVYKYGKPLNTYDAILIKMTGKYINSSDQAYQTMKEIMNEIEEKTRHKVFYITYDTEVEIYPHDNPFPIYISAEELPEHDTGKDAVYIFFVSSYKDTYLFEVYPEKADETRERLMHKIGFYFR